MTIYQELLKDVLFHGAGKEDRTGTGTRSVFGRQIQFDMRDGFPLLTTKKMFLKGVIAELLWIISGDTNVKTLQDQGVHIWDEWAGESGDLGRVYGAQWREFKSCPQPDELPMPRYTDQLMNCVDSLRHNPWSRRHIITAWNPGELSSMALPPCHCFMQFNVRPGQHGESRNILDLQLYQRSADLFLGVPFNIASYALFLLMMAQVTSMTPGRFVHTFGNLHIYNNHEQQVKTQLLRKPYPLPLMQLDPAITSITAFTADSFQLVGYKHHEAIQAPVSV